MFKHKDERSSPKLIALFIFTASIYRELLGYHSKSFSNNTRIETPKRL